MFCREPMNHQEKRTSNVIEQSISEPSRQRTSWVTEQSFNESPKKREQAGLQSNKSVNHTEKRISCVEEKSIG